MARYPEEAKTGKFITDEEFKEINKVYKEAQKTPVMKVGSVDLSRSVYERLYAVVNKIAYAHGLPDDGSSRYGIDGETRELLKVVD